MLDILSAPINDFIEPEVFSDEVFLIGEKHLGDIAISPAYVHRQCLRDLEDFNVITNGTVVGFLSLNAIEWSIGG